MAKLVDILAKEMDVWPDAEQYTKSVDVITQDFNGNVFGWEGFDPEYNIRHEEWLNVDGSAVASRRPVAIELAEDHCTAIVTKQQWQEAKAALNVEQPSVVWNGEGLPPVGTKVVVCNLDGYHLPKSLEDWRDGDVVECVSHTKINGPYDELSPVFFNKSRWSFSALREDCFTPIKTPEQVAEEKEKKSQIDNITSLIKEHYNPAYTIEQAAETIYNAGYRKQ